MAQLILSYDTETGELLGKDTATCETQSLDPLSFRGLDNYQLWLNSGESGTFQDYLETLKGPAGQDSPTAIELDEEIQTLLDCILDLRDKVQEKLELSPYTACDSDIVLDHE